MRSHACALLVAVASLLAMCGCRRDPGTGDPGSAKVFRDQVESAQPAVGSLMGVPEGSPVHVKLCTRAEITQFFETAMEVEYPNDELKKRGESLALLGLLPAGYDLQRGLKDLLQQQAGAVYDARSKTLIGVSGLPPEQRRAVNDRMILAHELTHALQDRVLGIAELSDSALNNVDFEYALRAVLEGMASGVMIAHAQSLPFSELPDLQQFWRSQISQAAATTMKGLPLYLPEYLMSPYAEGGSFIQSWLRANPDRSLKDLLRELPGSSEQVLHYEKYVERDEPTAIDLSGARGTLPRRWTPYYANTLGEFEFLALFQSHERTWEHATLLAAGWDGCRFETYGDGSGSLILFGSSVWDTEGDAAEFCDGLRLVLGGRRPAADYEVVQVGRRAGFIIGSDAAELRARVVRACVAGVASEG